MSTIQKFTFFGQKWQKIRFLGIKMVKNIIFGLVSWNNHYARCKAWTLVNSQKKLFLKLGNFTTHYSPSKRIYKIYILRIFEVAKTSKWSCPTSMFFHFLKLLCLLSNIYFEAREGIKTRWDTPIWIWVSRIPNFCTRKRTQLLHLRDLYFFVFFFSFRERRLQEAGLEFDENLYTSPLDKHSHFYKTHEKSAEKMVAKIMSNVTLIFWLYLLWIYEFYPKKMGLFALG